MILNHHELLCMTFTDNSSPSNYLIFLQPDEPKVVPVEVALLQIMSRPPICNTVIQLIEWFDEPDRYILILERPDPCKSLDSFLQDCGGYVTEDMARGIMWQSVVAALQCSKRGVLHRDIKLENLLINPDTLAVKLIDFGCGDLIKKSGYNIFEGKTSNLSVQCWYRNECFCSALLNSLSLSCSQARLNTALLSFFGKGGITLVEQQFGPSVS